MSRQKWFREESTTILCSIPQRLKKKAKQKGLNFSRILRIGIVKSLRDEDGLQNYFLRQIEQNKSLNEQLLAQKENIKSLREWNAEIQYKLKKQGIDY